MYMFVQTSSYARSEAENLYTVPPEKILGGAAFCDIWFVFGPSNHCVFQKIHFFTRDSKDNKIGYAYHV